MMAGGLGRAGFNKEVGDKIGQILGGLIRKKVSEGTADLLRSFRKSIGDFDSPRAMSTVEANAIGMNALGDNPIPIRNRTTGEIVGYRNQDGLMVYRFPQEKTRGVAAGRTQANLVEYSPDGDEIRNMHIDIEEQ